MGHYFRILLSVILFSIFLAALSFAAETRGLSVVAKDSSSGRQGEVRLYNKSYAVIIGIDRYSNLPAGRQLQNAVKDAKGVEDVLRKNYRFDKIITLHNDQATKDRIMEVLTEELPAQMGRDDALFLFWAGHGNQEKSEYGEIGYLIPYDGATDKIRKNITMAEIRDTVSKKIPAKHVFYVMDACYSGLLTTRSVDGKTRRDLSYLKEITKESARQVLTAGGKGEEALDGGPKGHSVFTGRLIEILENAPDFITANELQASIKEKVHSDASARNHTQTPGFGALYGLGDFVFIPKQQDRLGDLTGTSASRQKELEQLRKAEDEASAAKKREQAEIAKKEKELAALDKQIAEMKGRMGTSNANSDDGLDQILALAEQKEQQGERLEALRQQREAEERKRQQEIARLKQEALVKLAVQVNTDLAKYEKVATSKYAGDLKESAWKAMAANYHETKKVKVGDVDGFLAALGLARHNSKVVTASYTDPHTGLSLMWAWQDNGSSINWNDAKAYCENYRGGGYTDWRMPTQDELAGLYASDAHKDKIKLTNHYVWAAETSGSDAAYFHFNTGGRYWYHQSGGDDLRALPVRSIK
ncbi:MAG: caspase family protein [Deltaproteobacteria bacterium]